MRKKLSGIESKHFLKRVGKLSAYKQKQITRNIHHHSDGSITLFDIPFIESIDSTLFSEDHSLNIDTSTNDFTGGGGEFSGGGSSSTYEEPSSSHDSSSSSYDSGSSFDSSSSDSGSSGGGD